MRKNSKFALRFINCLNKGRGKEIKMSLWKEVSVKLPNIVIETLTEEDHSQVERLSMSPHQQNYVMGPSEFLKRSQKMSFLDRHKLFFAIKQVRNRRVVGLLILDRDSINPDKICWLSAIMIDRQRQGKGYARATLDLLLNHRSSPLRVHFASHERIMLSVSVYNRRAIGIYHNFGFKETVRSESRIVLYRDFPWVVN